MAKKKRKERRRKQQANAVARGDLSAMRAIADRNAEAGANALVAALDSGKADPADPDVVHFAEGLVDRVREKDRHDQVLRLAGFFPDLSPTLRLARALSAIAVGQDATAEADAAADARVGRIVAPMLAALHAKKIPRKPPKAPPAVRAAYALSRATAGCHGGALTPARTALRSIDKPLAHHFGVQLMDLALDLNKRRLSWHIAASITHNLLAQPLVRAHQPLRRSLGTLLASRYPRQLLEILPSLALPPEVAGVLSARASLANQDIDSDQARALLVIATVGSEVFEPEHRPVAQLFEAYGLLNSNPPAAVAAFDKAIGTGADLAEALRGRGLADLRIDRNREAARTYVRLAKLLEREPGGAPVAISAARVAIPAALIDGDPHLAHQALAIARRVADQAGLLDNALTITLLISESRCHLPNDPDKAEAIVEQARALDPSSPAVWQARVDIARICRRLDQADDIVLEAANLRISPDFVAEARHIRAARGETWTPEPGKATAGELAAEMHQRIANDGGQSIDDLLRCRDRLPAVEKTAFDMARCASLMFFDDDQAAAGLLREVLSSGQTDHATQCTWLLLGARAGNPEDLVPGTVERVENDPQDPIIAHICALLSARNPNHLLPLLPHLARLMTHSQLKVVTRLFGKKEFRAAHEAAERYLRPFDAALQPHYSLIDWWQDDSPVPAPDDDFDDIDDIDDGFCGPFLDELETILEVLGAPPDILDHASPAQIAEAGDIAQQMTHTLNPVKMAELARRLKSVLEGRRSNAPRYF